MAVDAWNEDQKKDEEWQDNDEKEEECSSIANEVLRVIAWISKSLVQYNTFWDILWLLI